MIDFIFMGIVAVFVLVVHRIATASERESYLDQWERHFRFHADRRTRQ